MKVQDGLSAASVARLFNADKKAAEAGETFKVVDGEVDLGGIILTPFGSNVSPDMARDITLQSAEAKKTSATGKIERLRLMAESTFESSPFALGRTREEFEENRAKGIGNIRRDLEHDYGFKGGEVATSEDGKRTLGAYTMSFEVGGKDYNGRYYGMTITASGGAGRDVSFQTSRLNITV